MKTLIGIALALTIVGAINWGLIGLFRFNLVSFLLGNGSLLENLVYIAVGISGILCLAIYTMLKE